MKKNVFISSEKLSLLLRYLSFSPNLFGHAVKQLVKKTNVNFKTCDIINWDTNHYNTQNLQYLKK